MVKLPKLQGFATLPNEAQGHIKTLERTLVNLQEDNEQYKAEYERIAEEGRLLFTTYASKSNQLKQLAALNVKLQADAQAAKEREEAASKEAEKERTEQAKWRGKVKEQTERYKDVFASLDKMKQQATEDAATIKRLQSGRGGGGNGGGGGVSVSASTAHAEAMADLERRHKAQIALLEKKNADLRVAASSSNSDASVVASLKERIGALTQRSQQLQDDNKSLLQEMALGSNGKLSYQAKLEQRDAEVARLSADRQAAQTLAAECTRRLEEHTAASAIATAESQARVTAAMSQLQQCTSESAARVAAVESQMAVLRQKTSEELATQEAQMQARANEYSRRLADAVAERDAWRERAEQLSVVLEKTVAVDEQQTAAAERMRETVSYLTAEAARVVRLNEAAKAAQKKAEDTLAAMVPMEEQARSYAEHIDRVEHRCTSLAKSLEETEQRAEQVQQREAAAIEALRVEREEQRTLCRDMEECAKETEAMLATAMSRVATAEAERDNARAEMRATAERLAQSMVRADELEQERNELRLLSGRLFEASQERDAELEEKEGELESVRGRVASLEASLAAQQSACREMSSALDRKIEEFRRSVEAKQDECNTLRKLLDEPREDASERKKRLELETRLKEAESNYECEREILGRTTELLAESEGETKRLTAVVALEQNQRLQMEVVQEALIDVLSEKSRCCCAEAQQLATALRDSRTTADNQLASVKEVAKLQKLVEQQNRYINESKAKSNANIRILHSQLTACKEQLALQESK